MILSWSLKAFGQCIHLTGSSVPKKHIVNIKDLQPEDAVLPLELMTAAQKLSKQLKAPGDFQFNINNGAQAGQTVFHMHVHFLSNSGQIVPGKLVI